MTYTVPYVCVHAGVFSQEREDALERERAAAACRLREACERYEAQMQADRLRLLADTGGAAQPGLHAHGFG